MTSVTPPLDELTGLVDEELRGFLDERKEGLPEGAPLLDEIGRVLAAGGKRLRPAFCYWGYRASGAEHTETIVRASAGLELLHTFAIVHDDIMDVSDERRGIPTTYALHGIDFALLVGDLALVLADAIFVASGFPPERLVAAFTDYSRMRQEVIAGQFLDVRAAARQHVTVSEARRIAVLKSGRYSIEEPLRIGAALAGADVATLEGLSTFGAPLGEAFQLRDDLLGTFGDRSSVGKPVDSDIREGKRHVLYAETIAALEGSDRDFVLDRWGAGDDLTAEDVAALRHHVESSGARRATEELLEELRGQAFEALARLDVSEEARPALEELADRATRRTW